MNLLAGKDQVGVGIVQVGMGLAALGEAGIAAARLGDNLLDIQRTTGLKVLAFDYSLPQGTEARPVTSGHTRKEIALLCHYIYPSTNQD